MNRVTSETDLNASSSTDATTCESPSNFENITHTTQISQEPALNSTSSQTRPTAKNNNEDIHQPGTLLSLPVKLLNNREATSCELLPTANPKILPTTNPQLLPTTNPQLQVSISTLSPIPKPDTQNRRKEIQKTAELT